EERGFRRIRSCVRIELLLPLPLAGGAAIERFPEVRERLLGHVERLVLRPAVVVLRVANVFLPERVAVRLRGVLLLATVPNVRPRDDDRRPPKLLSRGADRRIDL